MDTGITPSRQTPITEISPQSDTRDVLAVAKRQARERNYDDYLIVDVDAHHYETESWDELVEYIPDEVVRQIAKSFKRGGKQTPDILTSSGYPSYQSVAGRVMHGAVNMDVVDGGQHRTIARARHAIDTMGIDDQIVFPTPLLHLGMHRQPEVEVNIAWAYNQWLIERVCRDEPRVKSLIYLPFNEPEACVDIVEKQTDSDAVVGAMITSVRHRAVHHNAYMKLYAMLEERGLPLMFHAGPHWDETGYIAQLNRFIGVHAITFVLCNMVHMTNWIMNGLPERFPKLKVGWIESGVTWMSFMTTRLDNEYLMRSSEAPTLKRLPSEYMREMFFTSQPMERTNLKVLEASFDAINAKTQLLYCSDWPHWDFDLPSTIYDLPFLDEESKRNILGLNAARMFNLPPEPVKPRIAAE